MTKMFIALATTPGASAIIPIELQPKPTWKKILGASDVDWNWTIPADAKGFDFAQDRAGAVERDPDDPQANPEPDRPS